MSGFKKGEIGRKDKPTPQIGARSPQDKESSDVAASPPTTADDVGEAVARRASMESKRPQWMPDAMAPDCLACSVHFTTFTRKHHCRRCGGIFCQKCSQFSMKLPALDYARPVRVCKLCFKQPASSGACSWQQFYPAGASDKKGSKAAGQDTGERKTLFSPHRQQGTAGGGKQQQPQARERSGARLDTGTGGPPAMNQSGEHLSSSPNVKNVSSMSADERRKQSEPKKVNRYRFTLASSTPFYTAFKQFEQEEEEKRKAEEQGEQASEEAPPKKTPPPTRLRKVVYKDEELKGRVMSDVKEPEWKTLTTEDLFSGADALPNTERLREHLYNEGRLSQECALKLITEAADLMEEEPNIIQLSSRDQPVLVFGDIHGQFYDLLHLLQLATPLTEAYWLFLGDYVDRGMFSTEVCFYLFSLKINHPDRIFLLRGNHECRLLTNYFNFQKECLHKYGDVVYQMFMECFDCLPLAALITNDMGTFLAVHGGLSPHIDYVEDIMEIDRIIEPPKEGPLCDLLWSDPLEEETAKGLSADDMLEWYNVEYIHNPTRGAGFIFGYRAIVDFLTTNNLVSLIRAHEVQMDGYFEHFFLRSDRQQPLVITVFSAANYCDIYGNSASFMVFDRDGYGYQTAQSVEHPFYLPDFVDAINFSLPSVIENLAALFMHTLRFLEMECQKEEEEEAVPEVKKRERRASMQIRIEKLQSHKMEFSRLRGQRETIVKQFLEGPKGLVGLDNIHRFKGALRLDMDKDYQRPTPNKSKRRTW